MRELTKRQSEIYDYIKKIVQTKGYPPSVREIGEAVGLASSSTVHGHLSRLEEKGYIRRDPTKPRAIEIVSEQLDEVNVEQFMFRLSVKLRPAFQYRCRKYRRIFSTTRALNFNT